jgi:hypothetical protein
MRIDRVKVALHTLNILARRHYEYSYHAQVLHEAAAIAHFIQCELRPAQ